MATSTKFKIFSAKTTEEVERQVNTWLHYETKGIEIQQQTILRDGANIVLTIFYSGKVNVDWDDDCGA